MRHSSLLWWLIAISVVVRIFLILNPGFEADIAFWKSWGLATYDKGIVEGMKVSNNNYPTPFAYVLGSMVALYSRFADPHNFTQFWTNTNLLFLAISKLYPILADVGIAVILLYIGKNAKKLGFPDIALSVFGLSFYELTALVYLFSPVSLMDGAWWGQVDSLGLLIFLLALLSLLQRKPFLSGFVFMLSMMTKLQNMIYGPIFFLFVWQELGFDGLRKALGGAVIGFFGLNIEFFLSKNMDRVLSSLTENFDYFPWMSLNAFNLWWIVSGGHGMQVSDKLTVLGILNAKTVGLLLFSSFYLFAVLRQIWWNGKQHINHSLALPRFIESLIIVNASFFLFQTQSHDRYAFPLTVFLLLWAPFYLNTESKKLRLFSMLYSVFTILYFYNLHTALVLNYPHNGLPVLSFLTQPFFTITTSLVLLTLFGVFVFFLAKSSLVARYSLLVALGVTIAGLLILNKPLWTKQPVSLTKFMPFISEQAYGTRQVNRSVQSSFGGPNSWTRLSVQYVFYTQGFGTHANSRHVFDINQKFTTFTTDYGIDTESGPRASAIFTIYGDGKLLFQSEKMGRFDLPKHVQVNVSNVKYLELATNDAGDGNYDDHTDWLDPQLWP